jgi:hypothetical protein
MSLPARKFLAPPPLSALPQIKQMKSDLVSFDPTLSSLHPLFFHRPAILSASAAR